jgi:excisionase family DNA binding protein
VQNGADENLRVPEAAKLLGVKEPTVRAWILNRKIGYRKIGAAVRIPMSEIERINESGFVPARNTER